MSISNVSKLRGLIVNDPQLQARLAAAKSEADMAQLLVGIGADRGLPFTLADLDAWKAGEGASIELDEDKLHSVAGGRNKGTPARETYGTSYGNSIFCGFCGAQSGSFMS
ncbi:MAG: Nif11 family protein [Deltaproteobacteria bacterium]|nr:Nif11 family protein [Deltaproteobacteria bacterium]